MPIMRSPRGRRPVCFSATRADMCKSTCGSERPLTKEELSVTTVAIIGTRGYPSYYGGFETAVRRLAPYLADQGWIVRVYSRPSQVRTNDAELDSRIRVVETRGFDGKSLSTLSYGLTACLHAFFHKPDVALVMNCANGFWLPLLRLRGIPVLVNVDGIEWERAKWGPLAKFVFKLGARLTARFASRIVVDAEAIGDYWRTHFDRDGDFIPYGGDSSPKLELQDDVRPGYILLVARFVPENTILEFLRSVPSLSSMTDVVIVGSSGHGEALEDLAEKAARDHENVHWLGHVSDDRRLFALWQHCGVYFHGHSVGGTNPALVQAMALGAVVVARDTVYNREVLADTGIFCMPQPESIILAVNKALLSDDGLGARAKARAHSDYSWELVNARYDKSLRSLVQPDEVKASRGSAASV